VPWGLTYFKGARAAGTLKRLLEGLGIERQPRDVTPTLDVYLSRSQGLAERAIEELPMGSAPDQS
jgi:hypothetical protein